MTTSIILDVNSSEEFDTVPVKFALKPTKELLLHLLELNEAVVSMSLLSAEILSPVGEWLDQYYADEGDEHNLSEFSNEEILERISKECPVIDKLIPQMQDRKIKVMRDSIRFLALPKHGEDSSLCWTNKLYISEINEILNLM